MKEKSVTFTKGKSKFFQNHRKGRRRWLFCGEFRSLLSKLMFTDSAAAMEECKRKTRNYHQKLNVQCASRIAKQFRTYDLRKWGTCKAVYLSFHWFNDSRGFKLVTRGFELVNALKVSVFGVILACIFPHYSDWIQRDTKYLSVFSPNAGKYGPE